jgi:hypothetical protein
LDVALPLLKLLFDVFAALKASPLKPFDDALKEHPASVCDAVGRVVAAQYRDSLAFGRHALTDEHPVERVDVADAADRPRTAPSGPTLGRARAT